MRLLASITAIGLILLLMAGTGIRTLITVRFYTNQKEIAASKCENKAKPELKCNGKCYLAKQLKESENTNETSAPVSPERFQFPEISFLLQKSMFEFLCVELVKESSTLYSDKSYSSLPGTILQPPPELS